MDMVDILWIIAQIVLGVVIVYVYYIVCMWVMSADSLASELTIAQAFKRQTVVLNGVINAATYLPSSYNTAYTRGPNYLDIRRSVNRMGGAQFTYSFWMYVEDMGHIHENKRLCQDDEDKARLKKQLYTLFVKGDSSCYNYTKTVGNGSSTNVIGRYVMCPLVAIGDIKTKELLVYFNTVEEVDKFISIRKMSSIWNDDTRRKNLPSIVEGRWVMYTFVFVDYVPLTDFANGIVVKTYVNDTLYQMDKVAGTLRENSGDFCLLPDGPPGAAPDNRSATSLKLSTFSYYNYAMTDGEVVNRFAKGVALTPNFDVRPEPTNKLTLSAYNKLDIYNV